MNDKIEHIDEHKGYACGECGCIHFLLIKTGRIECAECGMHISRVHSSMNVKEGENTKE